MAKLDLFRRNALVLFFLLFALESGLGSCTELMSSYYKHSCPKAEGIIRNVVQRAFLKNWFAPSAFPRLFCPNGNSIEKLAPPNLTLQPEAFVVVDDVKEKLEEKCPRIVSCADILAYAARDNTKGRSWDVPVGRKDGIVSLKSEPFNLLPPSFFNVTMLTLVFNGVGLTQKDMLILSGSHTIGVSTCNSFIARLYNFNATFDIDPTLNPRLAVALRQACPRGNVDNTTEVNMDRTATKFDNSYYKCLISGKGLFTSDQTLFLDPATTTLVKTFANNQPRFVKSFGDSMIKMGLINVLTKSQGQIKSNCRVVNKYHFFLSPIQLLLVLPSKIIWAFPMP